MLAKSGTGIRSALNATVLVAALGYFVDIYDLSLFSIVRVPSLKALGYTSKADLRSMGVMLINIQMIGMIIGGLIWGVIGDRRGRLSVLFGSIIMYSLANIANGFVTDIHQYAVMRFIAGVGLAGELGAGITLVTETLDRHSRGYGTMIVATVGASGAILAHFIAEYLSWRSCYLFGGGLGLALLLLRIGVFESGMIAAAKELNVRRGNFLAIFSKWSRARRFILSILIGIPVWYTVGVLITFSPEISEKIGVSPAITTGGRAVMFCYLGLVIGDFISGLLSQALQSRKKVILIFFLANGLITARYLTMSHVSAEMFYFMCFMLGIGSGFWVLFCTSAAEQFGTNLRATVATSVPNFVRGSVVPVTLLFQSLQQNNNMSILESAGWVGVICIGISLLALSGLKESFGKDMNFLEE